MPKFTLEIEMNNAAFEESPIGELGRILKRLANDVNRGDFATDEMKLRDTNGNTVGFARYNPKG